MSDLGDTIRSVWDTLTFKDPNYLKVKKEADEAAEEEKKKKLATKDPDAVKNRGAYIDKKVKEAGG